MTREEAINELQNNKQDDTYIMTDEAIDMAIEALDSEPCEDVISRQAVQDYIAKYLSQYLYNDTRESVEVIDEYIGELPPVTPQPETAYWITLKDEYGDVCEAICSNCDSNGNHKFNYCPNCGRRMIEPKESEG